MKIFISYRHSDESAGTVMVVHDKLEAFVENGRVFLDNSSLADGDEFPSVIERELAACDIFLVLIDPHWIDTLDRLRDPEDWVRREIETALQRRAAKDPIRVIPVLLGVPAPAAKDLPRSLLGLTQLHAARLHGPSLVIDIAALAHRIMGRSLPWVIIWLQVRRHATLLVGLALVLLFSASLVSLFDALRLETGLEAVILAWADALDDPAPSNALVTAVIDEDTEFALGKKFDTGWRLEHAQLIRRMADAGASVVAFDMYLETASPCDAILSQAAEAARAKKTTVIFGSPRFGRAPPLAATVAESGFLCIGTELALARLTPLVVFRPDKTGKVAPDAAWGGPGKYLASFGVKARAPQSIIRNVDRDNRLINLDSPSGTPSKLLFSRIDSVDDDTKCAALAYGDQVAQRIVRFTRLDRLREPARRRRYQDLLGPPMDGDRAQYGGKIVLIGSELEAREIRAVFRGLGTENRYGHEIQADVINTLLRDVNIQAVSALPQFMIMVGMGLLGLIGRFWQPLAPRTRGAIFAATVVLLYLALGTWLCAQFSLLLNVFYHLAAFGFAFWISGNLLLRKGMLSRTGV